MTNELFGDAQTLKNSTGGMDLLAGGTSLLTGRVDNRLFGDGYRLENSTGGMDSLNGGSSVLTGTVNNTMYGDGYELISSKGGNDALVGGSSLLSATVNNNMFGDADTLKDSEGKTDVITGGSTLISGTVNNIIYGDARELINSKGGNDVIIAGSNFGKGTTTNTIYGDAVTADAASKCGNDAITSGLNTNDIIYGDAANVTANGGHDIFIFGGRFASDTVMDFREGEDMITFKVSGVKSIQDLKFSTDASGDVVIEATGYGTVTLAGVHGITAENCILIV